MKKKAQITVFVILGIVILITTLLLIKIYHKQKDIEEITNYDVFAYVLKTCLDISTKQAIYLAFYSGYDVEDLKRINYDETFYSSENFDEIFLFEQRIPLYLDKKNDYFYLLKQEEMEKLTADIFDVLLKECLINSDLEQYFNDVQIEEIQSRVEFLDEKVLFNVDYMIRIVEKNNIYEKNKEFIIVDYPLKEKIEHITNYLTVQKNNDFVSLGYLSEQAYINNYEFVLRNFDPNTVLVEFIFSDYEKISNLELKHIFAVSFDWS